MVVPIMCLIPGLLYPICAQSLDCCIQYVLNPWTAGSTICSIPWLWYTICARSLPCGTLYVLNPWTAVSNMCSIPRFYTLIAMYPLIEKYRAVKYRLVFTWIVAWVYILHPSRLPGASHIHYSQHIHSHSFILGVPSDADHRYSHDRDAARADLCLGRSCREFTI